MSGIAVLLERLQLGASEMSRAIPVVLSAPREHPREAMLLATLAALALTLLALVGYLVYSNFSTWLTRRRMRVRLVRRWPVGRLWACALVFAALAVMLLPGTVPASRACSTCHVMDEAVATWESSAHSGVACYGCHARPGLAGSLGATVAGVLRLASDETTSWPARIGSGRCLGCHDEIARDYTGRRVRMRHSDVIAAGMACTDCHGAVGHDSEYVGYERVTSDRRVMTVCLTCHDGERAPAGCDVCHVADPLDRASPQSFAASAKVEVTCDGCHRPETEARCVDCHGLVLPHPEEFMGRHAGMSYDDPSLCARCHEFARSDEGCGCHPDTNLHGTYSEWFPRHGVRARASWPGGCSCHDVRFCAFCHEESPF